jgi:autoinducer 2-degrading protein
VYVVAVKIRVKPGSEDAFLSATLANVSGTRKEPGNIAFEVSQGEEDPTSFFFYEVYRSKDMFLAHQQNPHYFAWRDAVMDLMVEPRQGLRYHRLLPETA